MEVAEVRVTIDHPPVEFDLGRGKVGRICDLPVVFYLNCDSHLNTVK